MALAVRQASHGESSAMTLELKVTFIAAVGPGRVLPVGRDVSLSLIHI